MLHCLASFGQDVRIRLREGTHIDVAVIHGFEHQVDIGHIAAKYGTRSVRMVARDDALEFTVFVAFDILHAVRLLLLSRLSKQEGCAPARERSS